MDRDTIIANVQALLPGLRERRREAEQLRRLPDVTVKELREAGLFRVLQPAHWGGYELEPHVFYETVMLLASACPATGWTYSVLCVHNWQLALMDLQAQQDVWGEDTNVLMASSYAPRGKVEAVDGGYRLSGRWQFSSGSEFSEWAIVGAKTTAADGTSRLSTFLVPRGDYRVEDVWHVMGLKGTGSNDLVVDDAFVPEHRRHDLDSGSPVSDNPLFALPFISVFAWSITAPMIGMATGAYEEHVRWSRSRTRASSGAVVAEEAFSRMRVADASGEIDTARASLLRSMDDLMAAARAGDVPMDLRARVRRDQARAVLMTVRAVDLLFDNSGASAIKDDSPMQQFWRDIHAARMHNSNVPEPVLAGYGALQFGIVDEAVPF
jgi:3-hydroxy-9,10-secoandrosta-1,3,5(10)-triene-9,17-dione monooxygenase